MNSVIKGNVSHKIVNETVGRVSDVHKKTFDVKLSSSEKLVFINEKDVADKEK